MNEVGEGGFEQAVKKERNTHHSKRHDSGGYCVIYFCMYNTTTPDALVTLDAPSFKSHAESLFNE